VNSLDPEALYISLVGDPSRLRKLRRLQYRCPERCLMLDAIALPNTVLLHQKRYKYSASVNEARSSSAGRSKNTFDGHDHWKPTTYFIESSALANPNASPVPRLGIQCDHVAVTPAGEEVVLLASDFHHDWDAGHTDVRVRRDGTRFAVE
jgi:hypothetical protein